MDKEASFFDRITFDPALARTDIARYFSSTRTILLIILTLSGAGLAVFFSLPRELNPNIQIPIVIVSTPFPGAGPEDIETLVTVPIEDVVSGLSGVQTVTSASQDNASVVTIEFTSGTDPLKDKSDIQSAVDTVTTLPTDAKTPRVQVVDFQNQPILTFLVSGSADPASLVRFADTLEERLKRLSLVEKVSVSYRRDADVNVILKPDIVREKRLDANRIAQSVQNALGNFPAGSLGTATTTLALTQETAVRSIEELRALPLRFGDTVLPLGEIAEVREQPATNAPQAAYATASDPAARAITFAVFKTDSADTAAAVQAITDEADRLNAQSGGAFVIRPIFDGAQEISKSFDQLFHDFSLTVLLVFAVLLTFFGLRQSIIAALAIPLTFLGTFIVMKGVGISINFIALFSLLLALGILVDNAIVIISAMASYERTGRFTPAQVALLVWRDFRIVIFTTTITTVWAFLPLLLASGIIGEFIKPIPIVVSSSLALSAAIALLVVIPMMAVFLEGHFPPRVLRTLAIAVLVALASALWVVIPAGSFRIFFFAASLVLVLIAARLLRACLSGLRAYEASHLTALFRRVHALAARGLFDFDPLAHRYERFIASILASRSARRKTLAALILFSLFSYSLVPLGLVVNEFFPQDNQDTVYASVELPKGTALPESDRRLHELLDRLRGSPDVRYVLGEIGAVPPSNDSGGGAEDNHLLFTLILVPKAERSRTSGDIVAELNREYGAYASGRFSASQVSGGPPAGSDLQLKLLGSDLPTLQSFGDRVSAYLRAQPGVSNVTASIVSGSSKVAFVPDPAAYAKYGVTLDQTAALLRTLGSGTIIKSNERFADGKRDVVLRSADTTALGDPATLGLLTVDTASGPLPLTALGRFVLEPNPTLITREDGNRSLSISASVEKGYSVSTLNAGLERFADTLGLPEGYAWKTGGVNDENTKSVQSILLAMLLSSALIFGTMTVQFNSFRKAVIVLLVVPLAVSGVFVLFALTGTPLSFPALIGILALFGIVVNNSIIMVDKINRNMHAGLPLEQAIAEGAASRLEPILLTALTTIVGLIPITLSDPIWQGLGGAIIAGLTFSGIAKLFFIPVIFRLWFGNGTGSVPPTPTR